MKIQDIIIEQKEKLTNHLNKNELATGEIIFNNGRCQILSQSPSCYELIIVDESGNKTLEYSLDIDENGVITPVINGKSADWDRHSYACLLQAESEMHLPDPREHQAHKKYTREGMIKRVLQERKLKAEKAEKAEYRIQWAGNIYGDHILTNISFSKNLMYRTLMPKLSFFRNGSKFISLLEAC